MNKLKIAISGIIKNNPTFVLVLGTCPTIAMTTSLSSAFAMGLATTFVLIFGMILLAATNNTLVCWIGVGLIAVSALFSIVTLPVEFNASNRAMQWLEVSGTLHGEHLQQARTALSWAARTYVVAALSAIATLLYYLGFARRE